MPFPDCTSIQSFPTNRKMDRVWPNDAGGSLGWRFFLHPGMAIDRQPQSQHVYADRCRRRRSLFLQAVAVVAPGIFPDSFRRHGEVDLYFEAAAAITTLVLLGQLIEAKARSRTGQAIKALLGLAAKTAHRIRKPVAATPSSQRIGRGAPPPQRAGRRDSGGRNSKRRPAARAARGKGAGRRCDR